MATGRGTFAAVRDSDSRPAEPPPFGETAAEDEAGAAPFADAVGVPVGQVRTADEDGGLDEVAGPPPDGSPAAAGQGVDTPDLSDDPMTMYLRDRSATPLLTREGEAALAKRIEAGWRTMLEGLCSSLPAIAAVSA